MYSVHTKKVDFFTQKFFPSLLALFNKQKFLGFISFLTTFWIHGRIFLTLPKIPGLLNPAHPRPRDTTPICVALTFLFPT